MNMQAPISTATLMRAISFYENLGYKMQDIPLIIDKDVCDFTKPSFCKSFKHGIHDYIGSAEQSFLQLIKDKKITDGKYQALSPCIRNEPILDETHYLIFLKLELIVLNTTDFLHIAHQVQTVMQVLGVSTDIVKTPIGVDLFDRHGIELGSYGTRTYLGVDYAYGTGIAEPRFSYSKNKKLLPPMLNN